MIVRAYSSISTKIFSFHGASIYFEKKIDEINFLTDIYLVKLNFGNIDIV